ncbi:acyl carrier protein [Isosphaera pallida]|nr:acyl carrier protein [Isosphaera pallida]
MIKRLGKLESLDPSVDFYEAGFSSINALQLLTELEDRFKVTLADDDFIAARTAVALRDLIDAQRR